MMRHRWWGIIRGRPTRPPTHITEHIGNDDDILDLSVEALPLPLDLGGQSTH